jgi:hypothetical protein
MAQLYRCRKALPSQGVALGRAHKALVLAALLLSATACASTQQPVRVWRDPELGCHYFRGKDGAMEPRNGPDGQHYCERPLVKPQYI